MRKQCRPQLLTADNQGQNAALSGAATGVGAALTGGLGRLVAPGMRAANPEAARLAEVAAKEGIPLDAAQRTGKVPRTEGSAQLDSVTAGAQQADEARQAAYNTAILKRLKSNASAATPDVLADVRASWVISGRWRASRRRRRTHVRSSPRWRPRPAQLPRTSGRSSATLTISWAPSTGIPGDAYATARSDSRLAYGSHPQVVDGQGDPEGARRLSTRDPGRPSGADEGSAPSLNST
jgi:hypothetical protein